MFFYLKPESSFLSDSNKDLINCYKTVRNHPIALSQRLEEHRANNSKMYYLLIREAYNLGGEKIDQAARFIYLNKACFNGIYRVNKQGKFNVPYGNKKNPSIPTTDILLSASSQLHKAELISESYESIVMNRNISKDDFIYLDPPYPPLNGTSNFIHYTQERFNSEDQEKLSKIAEQLNDKKCKIMITNADTPVIRKLYKSWKIITLPVMRWVSANGVRYKVNELLILNYDIAEG